MNKTRQAYFISMVHNTHIMIIEIAHAVIDFEVERKIDDNNVKILLRNVINHLSNSI